MKKIALILAIITIISCVSILLTGCGGGGGKLIGTWELESGSEFLFSSKITFKSGGKYVEVNDAGFDKEGKYSVKSDTEVEINYFTYNYKVEGDTLTLYSSIGGASATYKKK